MNRRSRARYAMPVLAAGGLAAGAFGGIAGAGASVTPKAGPPISVSSFNNTYSAMASLKSITAKGTGKVTAILPDEVSSARYVQFDAPDLTKALLAAELTKSEITVENALGSDTTEL